ncbi:unnamed protein product [Rhizophagus irregularis]|nr:unnamed protein product [Rhizophagus irregularis]
MEIVNANDENSFDPTPRLKSSPIPIKFISFNVYDKNCVYCGEEYIETLITLQKYCKKCLSRYINDIITDNNIYLDVYIYTLDLVCSEHEISRTKIPQNIQECCGNCVRILYFKQIDGFIDCFIFDKNNLTLYNKVIESEKNCKLCGKPIYQEISEEMYIKLCSDCYLISSGLIESTVDKKQISILYLPWWHNNSECNICNSVLTFTSDCQKYCMNCFIFYVGCRYCLTTNILFGPTDQSQCKKCKRISPINSDFDGFLFNNNILTCDNLYYLKLAEIENIVKNIDKYFISSSILQSIFKEKKQAKQNDKWIPYSQFKDVIEITRGGYGIIYKATWSSKNETVILKRFENSKNISKYFINELKSYYHCFKDKKGHIIETYGFTKDPELEDYILVMEYASGGDLYKNLQKDFARITWNREKLRILHQISVGLENIHNKKFMHRDFHSGNILFDPKEDTPECYANLMKSCWDADPKKRPSIKDIRLTFGRWTFKRVNDEEFRQGEAKRAKLIESKKIGPEFAEKRHLGAIYTSRPLSALISKCSSIYSFPKISFDKRDSNYTSELENNTDIESLSSQNLNSAIQKFPTALDSRYSSAELEPDINTESLSLYDLNFTIQNYSTALDSRYNSTELEFDINTESLSLYDLNSTIQNYSTALDSRYVSAELDLDINTESILSQNLSSTLQNYSTALDFRYISTELELDIKTERSQNLSSTIQNFSTSLKKRRNEELLNVETHNDSGKRIKVG